MIIEILHRAFRCKKKKQKSCIEKAQFAQIQWTSPFSLIFFLKHILKAHHFLTKKKGPSLLFFFKLQISLNWNTFCHMEIPMFLLTNNRVYVIWEINKETLKPNRLGLRKIYLLLLLKNDPVGPNIKKKEQALLFFWQKKSTTFYH